jgi:hypothetical protein
LGMEGDDGVAEATYVLQAEAVEGCGGRRHRMGILAPRAVGRGPVELLARSKFWSWASVYTSGWTDPSTGRGCEGQLGQAAAFGVCWLFPPSLLRLEAG